MIRILKKLASLLCLEPLSRYRVVLSQIFLSCGKRTLYDIIKIMLLRILKLVVLSTLVLFLLTITATVVLTLLLGPTLGEIVSAPINWLLTGILGYKGAKMVITTDLGNKRFQLALITGFLIALGALILSLLVSYLTTKSIGIGGGDILALLAGYLGGKQAAKTNLPSSEIPKTKWL